jgi:hypothetical protein
MMLGTSQGWSEHFGDEKSFLFLSGFQPGIKMLKKGNILDMFRIDKDATVQLMQALNFRPNNPQMFRSNLGWGYRLY